MANPLPVFNWATSAPTGTNYHQAGSYYRNSSPAVGQPEGWVCTVSGAPGTWVAVGPINSGTVSTVTAAASLSAGALVHSITGGGPVTLMAASAVGAGAEIVLVANTTAASVIAASSNTLVPASTGTIAASSVLRWISDGANYWYKAN